MKLKLLKKKIAILLMSCLLISSSIYAQSMGEVDAIDTSFGETMNRSNSSILSNGTLYDSVYNQLIQEKEEIYLEYETEKFTINDMLDLFEEVASIIGEELIDIEIKRDINLINYVYIMHYPSYDVYAPMSNGFDINTEIPVTVRYIDKELLLQKVQNIEEIIAPVIEKCNAVDTDLEKELIIHDFIVIHTAYDYENYINDTIPFESFTTYGLLVNKTAVCEGYARATKFLLNRVGIPCDIVGGVVLSGGAHAWNIVTIDGENYLLDTTWDDPVSDIPNCVYYNYFNIPDSVMREDHTWDRRDYPEATSEKYLFLKDASYTKKDNLEYIRLFNDTFYYVGSNHLWSYNMDTGEEECIAILYEDGFRVDEENLELIYTVWDYDLEQPVEEKLSLVPTETQTLLESYIDRFYEQCMGREAEEEGKTYWIRHLIKGNLTGADLAQQFINSPEFTNKNLTDTEYIEVMYKVFFDRQSDEEGVAFWKENLEQGLTRNYVLEGFVNSSEYEALCNSYGITRGNIVNNNVIDRNPQMTKFIYRLYEKCLDRKADIEGLTYWVTGLSEQDFTGKSVAEHFTNSEEFLNADLSHEAFMEVLYKVFFDRLSDENGMAYWMSQLENGMDRSIVLEGFIHSEEYLQICADYGIIYE